MLTTRGYSVTTSKHIHETAYACNHLDVIRVDNVLADNKEDHLANIEEKKKEMIDCLCKAKRARSNKDSYNSSALRLADEIKAYGKLFLPRHKFEFKDLDSLVEKQGEIEKRERSRTRKADKEYRERKIAENLERIEKWKAGESIYLPSGLNMMLRVKGDNVETSMRADVPKHQAKLFFRLCKACKDAGKAMTEFSHRVGVYTPNRIDEQGNATIGCHKLPYAEMLRISGQL